MSVEDRLSSIEGQYKIASLSVYDLYVTGSPTESVVSKAIKDILVFQRLLELLFEDTRKLEDKSTSYYVSRCGENVEYIRHYLRGKQTGKGVCDLIDASKYSEAFASFRCVRSFMYEFCEDVRLIYALRIYPIEEKMALKSELTDYNFGEVTKCLDEAETNLAEKHYKDCIDRCREAMEKAVALILVAEKKTPSKSFSTDVGTLVGTGIIDREIKKLVEATYSYMSEVGAHGRGGELSLADAHYTVKEAYMRIDVLMKKFRTYLGTK
jgi:uncharacterized protein (UPF0332 family)